MNATEHLVEQYVRHVLNWFTITNIKFGNREIDILAIDTKGKAYQIEVDMHKGGLQWGPGGNDGYTVRQYKQKKFDAKTKDFIRKKFGLRKTKDIWVCWGIHPKCRRAVRKSAKESKVIIWEVKTMLKKFLDEVGTTKYEDDITQTLSVLKSVAQCGSQCSGFNEK